MIILKKLIFDNWFSYGEGNSIDLDKDPISQLTGHVGAGKSSIPLIIQEILYGKNSKGIKKSDIQNRNTRGTVRGELHFSNGEHDYVVILVRKSSPKLTIYEDGKDISAHTTSNTYAILHDIIGQEFSMFSPLTYQSSKSALDFLTSTDTNRKKFLIKLFKLDSYIDIFNGYKEAIRIIDKDIARIEGSVHTIKSWIDSSTKADLTIKDAVDVPTLPKRLMAEKGSLERDILNIDSKNKEIYKNNQYKELLQKIDGSKLVPPDIQCKTDKNLAQKRHENLAEKRRIKSELDKIKRLGDKCHVCMQKISSDFKEDYIQQLIDEHEVIDLNLSKLENEIKEMTYIQSLWDEYRSATQEFESLSRYIDPNIPDEPLNPTQLKGKLDKLSSEISSINRKISEAQTKNLEISKHNSKVSTILEQLDGYRDQLDKNIAEVNKLRDISNNLHILKDVFSTNGLVSYKLQYLVQDLQKEITKYLIKLSDGRFELSFRLDNDKLNIKIFDNGNDIDIEALSSGEMAKVNIATLLAIRSIMLSISNTKLNILFLDESINTLDVQSRDSLIECLLDEVQLNIFIMSHAWRHPMVPSISVYKDSDGISHLEEIKE